ncbi:hypothetical protein [Clostridium scatologenes]|uniref:Uncharacterized protein n=1 Tax=Clostridium scatologenes TaxID=1548 RepID=A0A0E3GRH1_CLOSL|nr:hypothetical protein [Clostridium scatologenes]AKA70311.1 hypothetical protein CSCA_3186 [Clostridium scatologenes]
MNIDEQLMNKIIETTNNIDICWGELITNHIKDGMKGLDIIFKDTDYIINGLSSIDNSFQVSMFYDLFVEIEKALKSKDYMLVADLLKYELKTVLIKCDLKNKCR